MARDEVRPALKDRPPARPTWIVEFSTVCLLSLSACLVAQESRMHEIRYRAPCGDDQIAVYAVIPINRTGEFALFLPAPGYVDHSGLFGSDGLAPHDSLGVAEELRDFLVRKGFVTITWDKPGTGASTGRLNRDDDFTLQCVFRSLYDAPLDFGGRYLLLAWSAGAAAFQSAFPQLKEQADRMVPAGLVHFAGVSTWFPPSPDDRVPVLSVLADSTGLGDKTRRTRVEAEVFADSLTRILFVPGVDDGFCLTGAGRLREKSCSYPHTLFEDIHRWMQAAMALVGPQNTEMKIDLDRLGD